MSNLNKIVECATEEDYESVKDLYPDSLFLTPDNTKEGPFKLEEITISGWSNAGNVLNENEYYINNAQMQNGETYLLVDKSLGILGTICIAFKNDYSSYQTEYNKKTYETNLGTFKPISMFFGYYYIGMDFTGSDLFPTADISAALANLKIYKLTIEV